MSDLLPYQYVVLRCVPRADRDEHLNVGVVLHCQAADHLAVGAHLDRERLAAAFPSLDLDALDAALVVVDDVCRGIAGAGRPDLPTPGRRFGWLSAPRSTVLRPSAVHSGPTLDPAAEIDTLLDRLVR